MQFKGCALCFVVVKNWDALHCSPHNRIDCIVYVGLFRDKAVAGI